MHADAGELAQLPLGQLARLSSANEFADFVSKTLCHTTSVESRLFPIGV